jgi:hypothetical protein
VPSRNRGFGIAAFAQAHINVIAVVRVGDVAHVDIPASDVVRVAVGVFILSIFRMCAAAAAPPFGDLAGLLAGARKVCSIGGSRSSPFPALACYRWTLLALETLMA